MQGGFVQISGGMGSSDAVGTSGGTGGDFFLNGGEAKGLGSTNRGGNIQLTGGSAVQGTGGAIQVVTGFSSIKDSGEITFSTANSGMSGISGFIALETGSSSYGTSGAITAQTGDAIRGAGGDIEDGGQDPV